MVFSLATDLFKAYKANELEQELEQVKNDITQLIKGTFKDIYDILSDDEKVFAFFAPQLKSFEEIVREMNGRAELIRSNREKVVSIQEKLENISLSFK